MKISILSLLLLPGTFLVGCAGVLPGLPLDLALTLGEADSQQKRDKADASKLAMEKAEEAKRIVLIEEISKSIEDPKLREMLVDLARHEPQSQPRMRLSDGPESESSPTSPRPETNATEGATRRPASSDSDRSYRAADQQSQTDDRTLASAAAPKSPDSQRRGNSDRENRVTDDKQPVSQTPRSADSGRPAKPNTTGADDTRYASNETRDSNPSPDARLETKKVPQSDQPADEADGTTLTDDEPKRLSDNSEEDARPLPKRGEWKGQLAELISALELQVNQEDSDLRKAEIEHLETILAMLHLLANDREAALSSINLEDPHQQEFWKEMLFALSVLLEPSELDVNSAFFTSDFHRSALSLDHIRRASAELAPLAKLQVKNIALCEEVSGFGNYREFTNRTFETGQQAIVYCELENYHAESVPGDRRDGQQFESEFQSSITIYDENKKVMEHIDYQPVVDRGRNRRRDFYVHYIVTIPEDLPEGRYQMQIHVEDIKGNKSAHSSPLEFRVR